MCTKKNTDIKKNSNTTFNIKCSILFTEIRLLQEELKNVL